MDEPERTWRPVVIDHHHLDVLDLHVHHPRHDTHNHDGEYHDELRQESVPPDLNEFFLQQIFQHSLTPLSFKPILEFR
jgi:hypothetical protein